MATVTLDRLWLHTASDLSTYRRFFTSGRSDDRSITGDVRTYANGRLRIVSRVGAKQQLGVTLEQVTDADLVTLESWRGVLLYLRDHRGRTLFGTYFSMKVDDYLDRSGYAVSVTFQQVTSTVAV